MMMMLLLVIIIVIIMVIMMVILLLMVINDVDDNRALQDDLARQGQWSTGRWYLGPRALQEPWGRQAQRASLAQLGLPAELEKMAPLGPVGAKVPNNFVIFIIILLLGLLIIYYMPKK
jgi:hypothetical protein